MKYLIKNYYKLFDEKLENWTMIIIIIAVLILFIWVSMNFQENKLPEKKVMEIKN